MKTTILPYRAEDFSAVSELFCETISTVNAGDYSPLQCKAWIERSQGLLTRKDTLLRQRTLLAKRNALLVGFGSIDGNGYLDLLYVRKDFLRGGIASALCDELEKGFLSVETHASMTAKPFFETRGYATVCAQEIHCNGVALKNFVMRKRFPQ